MPPELPDMPAPLVTGLLLVTAFAGWVLGVASALAVLALVWGVG